jgi:hypothetical protein
VTSGNQPIDGLPEDQLSEPLFELPKPHHRSYPSTWGGVFFLVVLTSVGVAIWLASSTTVWRLGVILLGITLLAAAALRCILANSHAGMLAVRHWLLDVFLLSTVGVVLIVLAISIPNQPGTG